ncbi:MAG: condensation domain-containing protein [Rhodomicrobium sp.]
MTHTIQLRPHSSLSAELHDDCHDNARRGGLPRTIRQLGSVEHLFWLLDQHRPTHFAVTAHVSGRTGVAAWQNALDQLQRRHSLMSVAIVGEPGRVPHFQQRRGARIPLRVIHDDRTARWEEEVAAELANPFGAADAPLIRAVLIHADEDAALILVAHHAIADGMSLAYAIRDILSVLSGDTLAALPSTPSADDLLLAASSSTARAITNEKPQSQASGVPERWRTLDGAKPSVHSLQLPRALTARLRDRARVESTTVHCALAAALVIAGRKLAPNWRDIPVRVMSPVNVRRMLGAGEHCGDYVSSASSVFTTEGDDFWCVARKVKADIELARTPEGVESVFSAIQAFLGDAPDVKAAADFAAVAFANEALLTNLGSLPFGDTYGHLKLNSLWGPCVLLDFENVQTIGVATVNGSICLAHTSYAPIVGLLEEMQALLAVSTS